MDTVDTVEKTESNDSESSLDYEAKASELGWVPKDKFRGDPAKHVDAKTYWEKGELVLPIVKQQREEAKKEAAELRKQLAEVKSTMGDFQKFTEEAAERKWKAEVAELRAAKAAAVEAGDKVAYQRADDALEEIKEARRYRHHSQWTAAQIDALTGISNRKHILEQLEERLGQLVQRGQPCGLVVLDLDHFKEINDKHGHQVGDTVLTNFVHCVEQVLRRPSVIGRYGGEEFVVILPETSKEQAIQVAERIQSALSAQTVPPKVTASIGVACSMQAQDDTLDAMIGRADSALYAAKRNGRMPSLMAWRRSASMPGSALTRDLKPSLTTSSSYKPMRPMNPVMRQSTQPTGL